ncbi:MAG: metalloprotease PmbA [Gammaproteobacteria bacterium]|nr:metalloprotease PmbA [Gammaproteobacteria bacterium]
MQSQPQDARVLIDRVLSGSRKLGADAAEADINTGRGLSVNVRMGQVETIEHQRDKGLGITVYMGGRKGSASTSDFSDGALEATVNAACTIARHASQDDCAGLIDPEFLATSVPDLDLCHNWEITPQAAIELAVECETAARREDARLTNSDGSLVGTYSGSHLYGNTHGFVNGWDWSSHNIDCTVIAEENGRMQRDGWYTKARDQRDLENVESVGREAARRTLSRLNAKKLTTRSAPVIFEAPVARGLFSAFITAVSGGALYRRASFLLDKLGEQVFNPRIQIEEQPHLPKELGSAPFDDDGMATRRKHLVRDGVLESYVLSAYSARKLGMTPTGNAGGVHNLVVQTGEQDLDALIRQMDTGLLITDMIGFGVNQVTGDYSRGASGFWIEQGEVRYPVEEITVAANLKDMFQHIVDIANDVDNRGNIKTGSVLIENMTIAGE